MRQVSSWSQEHILTGNRTLTTNRSIVTPIDMERDFSTHKPAEMFRKTAVDMKITNGEVQVLQPEFGQKRFFSL